MNKIGSHIRSPAYSSVCL